MKKQIILSTLLILLCLATFSQESDSTKKTREFQTLLGHNRPGGFYGSFTIGYSEIDNYQAVLIGGKIMWIAGHSIGFGFGGTGFINEYHYEPVLNRDVFLTGGYGGLYIEPILMPNFPVHLSFPCLFGAGGISYISKESSDYHNMIEDSEAFLIAEPAAELELNLTRHFRFAIGASYRFTTAFEVGGNSTQTVNSESLKGFSYMLTFKFGRF
jgi:hypothetical protein